MRLRLSFLLWLVLLLLPIAAGSLWTARLIDRTLQERIASALADSLRLETARILESLARYSDHAVALSDGAHLQAFLQGVLDARAGDATDPRADPTVPRFLDAPPSSPVIGGVDGFAPVDPAAAFPLDELANRLLEKAALSRTEIVALAIVDPDGTPLGRTPGFSWRPADHGLLELALSGREPRFGDAWRETEDGDARLGLIAPVFAADGEPATGALLLETRLGPIVDLVEKHAALASTTEAHIAQRTPGGEAQLITRLRFDPLAAFSGTVPAAAGLPINQALDSPQARVLRATDYRGADSIAAMQTLEPTGWGVVVKIDAAEAFAPVADLRNAALVTAVATIFALLVAWLFALRPLGARLQKTAAAAERIAHGRLDEPIGDERGDEIGDVARAIDRLAADLDSDRRKRSAAELQLRHQATHDELTGLANRKHAQSIIESLEEVAGQRASIVFLDLDRFKEVNDLFGHRAGDEVLVAIAQRLLSAIDTDATVARWGGDEFLVILPDADGPAASRVAANVRCLFDDPVSTSAGKHRLGCSVGVATASSGRPLSAVLAEADALMYEEKHRQRATDTVDAFAARAVESALQERRVELWMQPVASVPAPGSTRLVGAEALVRLRSRDGGIIAPDDFLAAVRKAPLGRALDQHVLRRSIEALSRWLRAGVVDDRFRLSINVTGASLRQSSLPSELSELLRRCDVPPGNVIIEISEKTGDIDAPLLDGLRAIGVGIALDDVGLHRSNIDRLVAFAPDIAKIDQQWLDDPVVLPRLVDLCRELGMQLVAEGVETPQQLERLQALAVSRFQGYLFDRPRPAVQFIERWGRLSGPAIDQDDGSPQPLRVVG